MLPWYWYSQDLEDRMVFALHCSNVMSSASSSSVPAADGDESTFMREFFDGVDEAANMMLQVMIILTGEDL